MRQMEEKTAPPPTTVPEEILDRISVKDGARIHIIPIKEIEDLSFRYAQNNESLSVGNEEEDIVINGEEINPQTNNML